MFHNNVQLQILIHSIRGKIKPNKHAFTYLCKLKLLSFSFIYFLYRYYNNEENISMTIKKQNWIYEKFITIY